MTYSYFCGNKNCSGTIISDGKFKVQIPKGMKNSCCDKCSNTECPDYGECNCFNYRLDMSDERLKQLIKNYYNQNDIEIKTYD